MQPLPPGTNFIPEMSIPLSVFICSGDVLLAQVLLKLKNDPNKAKTLFYCINLIYLKKKKNPNYIAGVVSDDAVHYPRNKTQTFSSPQKLLEKKRKQHRQALKQPDRKPSLDRHRHKLTNESIKEE